MTDTPKTSADIAASKFLNFIYGQYAPNVWTCGFASFPGNWTGGRGAANLSRLSADAANLFFCIGEIGSGEVRRSSTGVERQHLLIVDDIGTKVDPAEWDVLFALGMPKPCFRIETSIEPSGDANAPWTSNQTWVWMLDTPIGRGSHDVADWDGLALLRAHLAERKLTDNVMDEARYVRLPMGWNSKEKYAGMTRSGTGPWPSCSLVGGEALATYEAGGIWGGVPLEVLGRGLLGDGWRAVPLPKGAITSASLMSGAGGALVRTATMDYPEPLILLAQELGMNPVASTRAGVVEALCPNIDAHGDRPETGFAFLGSGLSQCSHASCQELRSADFQAMMVEKYDTNVAAVVGAGLTFVGPQSGAGFLAAAAFADAASAGIAGGAGDQDVEGMAESMRGRAAVRAASADEGMAQLALRFVWCNPLDVFYDTVMRRVVTPKAFDTHKDVLPWIEAGGSGKKRAFNVLINRDDVQFADGMAYVPGETAAIVDLPGENGVIGPHINTWVPSDVRRVAGVPTRWLELVEHVIPCPLHRNFYLDWLAYVLQNPVGRTPLIPLIIGGQGIGKDMFFDAFRRVLGAHNCAGVDAARMANQFNEWMQTRVAYSSELQLPADGKLYNKIKEWTGMGVSRLEINAKYQRPYNIDSCLVFFAFSNGLDSVRGLEADDRRWVIYQSPAEKNDKSFYAAMANDLESAGELGRVMDFLLSRDLSKFDRQNAPVGVGGHRRLAMAANLSAPAEWAHDYVADGGELAGRKWVTVTEVLGAAQTSRDNNVSRGGTARGMAAGLLAAGWVLYGRVRTGTARASLWISPEVSKSDREAAQRMTGAEASAAYATEYASWLADKQKGLLGN